MADGSGFKHITVSAEPDEDEVVFAGIHREASGKAHAAQETGQDAVSEASACEPPAAAAVPVAPVAPAEPDVRIRPDEADDYPDELDAGPMPLAQRIVIVAAIVCLIGAIVYCVAFMR